MNNPIPNPLVHLHEEETGADLPMYIAVEIEKGGQRYALLAPSTPVVYLFAVSDDEDAMLEEAEDSDLPQLQPAANIALAGLGLKLERIGSDLRLSDELPDSLWEEGEFVEIEIDEEGEEHLVVADFSAAGKRYWLVTALEPQLIAVELREGGPRPLEEEELDQLDSDFRAALDALDEE